ncbi:MAG TPA: lipopolysaccharide biosynthesis protein [Devosia sp.]|nr:lipopolysaccharide biosynthesis protein [Devosia sp.]
MLKIPADLSALLHTGLTRSLVSLLIKVATAGLTYLAYVVLSRTMNGTEYGLFASGLALATVLAIGAGMGQQIAILRFWSEATAKGQPQQAIVALRAGGSLTIIASMVIGLGLVLVGFAIGAVWPNAGPVLHLYATAALILPMALAEYNSSALRAQGSVLTALAPRDIVWRILLPVVVAAMYGGFQLGLAGWQALLLAAALLLLALALQYGWAASRGYLLRPGMRDVGAYWRERGTVSRWFLLGAVVDTVALNADTILVGLLVDAQSAGLYFNAFRTAGLMTLFGYAVTLVIAPMLAQHYHAGDMRKAQAITAACVWAGFICSLIAFAGFVLFGTQILSLFGAGYGAAYPVLLLLGIGLLFDAATGPARTVMMMTGHERSYVAAFGAITILGLVLQVLVLPVYGLIGAAAVNMLARIASQLLIGFWCITRVGIDPTIFGIFKIRRHAAPEAPLSPRPMV